MLETDLFTMPQKRILSAIKYEFIKLNDYNSDYSKVMEPLSDEAYTALIKEWNKPTEDELLNEQT